MQIGDKLSLDGSKIKFVVKALSARYAICVKNQFGRAVYTIIDRKERIRSTNNMVFNSYDYLKQEDIDKCLQDLENGDVGLSMRNKYKLEDWIK
ncbi:hypothetical protein PM10SUCC1_32750 [Propionigenium maris DSM 9537]|uniref:Uncharacterized protein n=1 Tax=Propionigenium maris DSM 9537 TaxID=1123000 RepID=A0A9W6GPP3_9FUSO|nr:hypothetical protein [Propionigenium maris]GLI57761.1 hypothetical protein PM10SUCC1_32750 [Propionigenium maris DSM 9537]